MYLTWNCKTPFNHTNSLPLNLFFLSVSFVFIFLYNSCHFFDQI
nr:MAG TPA: hypothetical protein [Caudoviricetes sp.]